MEGLEISEIKMSFLKKENRTFRIDSNFFIKKSLSVDNKIKSMNHFYISEENIVSGPFGSSLKSDAYLNAGVPFIRIENIKNGFSISTDNLIYISEFDNSRLKSSQLFEDDLILSKVGNTIGYYARVDSNIKNCNISENNIGIKLNSYNRDVKHYIMTFLNSKYGNILTLRRISGNAQPKLNVFDISEIPIPQFNEEFYKKISDKIIKADELKQHSKSLYSQAEDLLLGELGLKDWQPKNTLHTTKKFSDFAQSGRLDAEYYQPKYDEIEKVIKSYKGGYDIVSNLFNQNLDVCDYKKTEYNYVEIGDVNVGDGSVSFNKVDTSELPDNAKRVLHKNDILISKVRPYRGAVAIIDFEQEDLIGSGAFTVLQEKSSYKKETLQILFRTAVYKDWLLKWNVGSSYPVIKDEDILNLPIPILPEQIQKKIASLIQQSFEYKAQSKQLLEDAKRMVEAEIEKN